MLAASWDTDEEAKRLGSAVLEPVQGEVLLPGLVELVAIPLLVNVASTALCTLVSRLVRSRRSTSEEVDLEVVEMSITEGERVIVVRRTRRMR
jgi:hypothetical protein